VVVGVAVGLRLDTASVGLAWNGLERIAGGTWFRGQCGPRRREAWALMLAAGPAWDAVIGAPLWWSEYDRRALKPLVSGRHGYATVVRAATALLAGLAREHARVTRALLERDLTGADLAAICRGEPLDY
jgi:hypothetical protein